MRVFYLALLLFAVSCSNRPNTSPLKLADNICQYSEWLRIFESDSLVTIEIVNPDLPKDVLVISLPKTGKFDRISSSKEFFFLKPITKFACLSSTHIGMLSILGLEKNVVAVSDIKYVSNAQVRDNFNKGKVRSLNNEQGISPEAVLATGAEIVIYSSFSKEFPNEFALRKAGVSCIPNFDWREKHPLGKAEWLLLFGYLTGNGKQAKEKFVEICSNYKRSEHSAAGQIDSTLMFSGNLMGDFWYVPGGNSFQAKLFKDAGLIYVFLNHKGTGSTSLAFETILNRTSEVSLWLNPGFSSKKEILRSNPKAKFLNILKKGKIFCYSHDPNKFWELSACRPDLVLSDYTKMKKASKNNMDSLFFYKLVE